MVELNLAVLHYEKVPVQRTIFNITETTTYNKHNTEYKTIVFCVKHTDTSKCNLTQAEIWSLLTSRGLTCHPAAVMKMKIGSWLG